MEEGEEEGWRRRRVKRRGRCEGAVGEREEEEVVEEVGEEEEEGEGGGMYIKEKILYLTFL